MPYSCIFTGNMDVSSLTHPKKPCRQSTDRGSSDSEDKLEGQRGKGNKESCRKIDGISNGGDEHLILYFPLAGGRVDGGEDEGEVADCDVGGSDDGEVGLLVDVGDDG